MATGVDSQGFDINAPVGKMVLSAGWCDPLVAEGPPEVHCVGLWPINSSQWMSVFKYTGAVEKTIELKLAVIDV